MDADAKAEIERIRNEELPALRAEIDKLCCDQPAERVKEKAVRRLTEKLDDIELELALLKSVGQVIENHIVEYLGRDERGARQFRVLKVQ